MNPLGELITSFLGTYRSKLRGYRDEGHRQGRAPVCSGLAAKGVAWSWGLVSYLVAWNAQFTWDKLGQSQVEEKDLFPVLVCHIVTVQKVQLLAAQKPKLER